MRKKLLTKLIGILLILTAILASSCSSNKDAALPEKLIIADQFGLAYAPLEIMKSRNFLETELAKRNLSAVSVEWKRMGNTAAMREAMVSGDLDIGFVAIPPFLIGRDMGMDWRIISAVSESPVGLVSSEQSFVDLTALPERFRILLPQPGSIQHILLSMYAEKHLGNAEAFDNQLIAMSHPDAMTAMLSNDTSLLHFTTPPYLQQELDQEGFKLLLDGEDCFGSPFTFTIGICPERVYQNNEVYEAFQAALSQSVSYMNDSPKESIEILSQAYEYSPADLADYLASEQMKFSTEVRGLETFISFMKRTNRIKEAPKTESLFWSTYE